MMSDDDLDLLVGCAEMLPSDATPEQREEVRRYYEYLCELRSSARACMKAESTKGLRLSRL